MIDYDREGLKTPISASGLVLSCSNVLVLVLVGARVRSRAYDVEDSDNSDDDDDEYSESGDVVGHFLSEVAGTDGGDASWGEFCGPCCTGANNKDDTTEEVEVDGEAKSSAAPSFDGHQQTLMLNTDNVKKRRVIKKVSITTTQGPPKVISPADVAQLYRGLRRDECCVKAFLNPFSDLSQPFLANILPLDEASAHPHTRLKPLSVD